jgi:hypothetical protein
MRKSQKIESLRLPFPTSPAIFSRESAKLNKSGLVKNLRTGLSLKKGSTPKARLKRWSGAAREIT